jgi:hypothetical protein
MGVRIVRDELWLCVDCLHYAVNDDLSGIDCNARAAKVREGVHALGPNLVPHYDSESGEGMRDGGGRCAACGQGWGFAEWHRFAAGYFRRVK